MPKKLFSHGRRYLGILRFFVVIIGFVFAVHITHRECARVNPSPIREASPVPDAVEPQPAGNSEVFQATAYCISGITKSGVPTTPGIIAADPEVIPLGSMIYVESPLMGGFYQVMDTGKAIKGKIIDIFIPSYEACINFGRRMVKVKVLRYGFEENEKKEVREPTE